MSSESKQVKAFFTKYEADKIKPAYKGSPKERIRLVKSFSLNEDGSLKKGSPGIINTGKAKTVKATLEGLQSGLKNLTQQQCIGLGTYKNGAKIGWKHWENEVRRTKDNFTYHENEPSLFYFDIDGIKQTPHEIITILESIIPGLSDAGKLIVYSSSAGLKKTDGTPLKDSTSAHVYIIIEDGTDAERFMSVVFDRLWLAGHGFFVLSKAPSLLKRGIIDQSVWGSERLIYEGSPNLGEGIRQERPDSELISGGALDSSKTLHLSQEEIDKLTSIITEKKEEIKPEMKTATTDKIENVVKTQGIYIEEAKKIVTNNKKNIIEDGLLLFFKGEPAGILASDVIKDGEKWDKKRLADPFEPTYDGSSKTKAIFFWNDGSYPVVNSNAHGGFLYSFDSLRKTKKESKKKKEKDDSVNEVRVAVKKMNNDHAAVLAGGSFVILQETKNPVSNSTEITFLKKDTFTNFYGNQKIWVNSGDKQKQVSIPKLWLEHENRRTYKGVIFDPAYRYPKNEYYNLFVGFNSLEPVDGDISVFMEHVLKVACNGREDKRDYLMRWFQRALLDPGGDRPGVSLVFHGGRGCGKGTVMDWFSPLFSPHYVHLTDGNMLTGKFNKHLSGNILCFADEAVFAKDKREENKLKGLITEKKLFMEAKNFDAVAIDSHINIVMASNNDHVIGAGRDERRYAVFSFNNDLAQNGEYFNTLDASRCNGGLEALLFHLLHTDDYSHVDLRSPPATKALDDQKQQSLDSTETFWMDVLERGYIISPTKNGEDSAIISQINADNQGESVHGITSFDWEENINIRLSFVYDEYLLFCREKKERFPVSNRSFWNKTKRSDSSTAIFKKGMFTVRLGGKSYLQVGSLSDYREMFLESVCFVDWESADSEIDGFTPFDGQF